MFLIWLIASLILTPIVIIVIGPHLPPGHMSAEASDQTYTANTVLTAFMTPILVAVVVFFGYSLIVFRQGNTTDPAVDALPIKGNRAAQTSWIVVTVAIVLFLAGWGTYRLDWADRGAGGGQGPTIVTAMPPGHRLVVQVIAQQWSFTYRFPQFGGVETSSLEIPLNHPVQFDVTSLDVIHSFWAYELGVKADAVPGTQNIAVVTPTQAGTFQIRCAELCGLFHGQMSDYGHVVTYPQFATWIQAQQHLYAPIQKYLPKYTPIYNPQPGGRAT
jgi:cytochrome c oxidase subunit 2